MFNSTLTRGGGPTGGGAQTFQDGMYVCLFFFLFVFSTFFRSVLAPNWKYAEWRQIKLREEEEEEEWAGEGPG